MQFIRSLFLIWGSFVGLATLVGLIKFRKERDQGIAISGGVNLAYALLTVFSALDLLMFQLPDWWSQTVTPVGLLILLLSQLLSFWSGRELKRNFSPQLKPDTNGSLVTTGPFGLCRHPIMLAYLMGWIGTAMALGSMTMALGFGLISIFIMRRVALEEIHLESTYGEEFIAYKNRVSVMVPCLDPLSEDGKKLEEAVNLLKSSNWKTLMGVSFKK